MCIIQTEHNKILVLTRLKRLKIGIGQMLVLVLTRQNRPNYSFWTDQPDQNLGFALNEHIEI